MSMSPNEAAVRRLFPGAIKSDENGFYYENADMPPARFYFKTFAEAAEDLAIETQITDDERNAVAKG